MDFQKFADSIDGMACVLSVEKKEKGDCGEIRFAAANEKYIESLKGSLNLQNPAGFVFEPGSLYTRYIIKSPNFENFCFQAAIEKKSLHSYVQMDRSGSKVWFHSTFLPLNAEEENTGYCALIVEIKDHPDAETMSGISGELAAKVLEISIKIDGTTDFKSAMNDVIKDIRKLCGAKRCCIFLMDTQEKSVSVLCEDIAPDADLQRPMSDIIDPGFYPLIESWESILGGNSSLFLRNGDDMQLVKERNPNWYARLLAAQVKSMIMYPLRFAGRLLGYIWATNFDSQNAGKIKETLEVTSFILGSEIANYLLLNKLRILSSRDLLTGVMNRNEMNGYVDRLSNGEEGAGKTAGVIFADLNGLKYVNDNDGHPAGDELLKNAAAALREVFDEETIFRAGGDEFTIIVLDVTEEELEKKVEDLRAASGKYDKVSFAVGYHLAQDAREVRAALRIADENMYLDKEHFYKTNPEIMRGAGLR